MKSSGNLRSCACFSATASLALFLAMSATASQINMTVNTNTSSMSVQLCANPGIGQACDSDTAKLSGSLVVSLYDNAAPSAVALRNFNVQAMSTLNLNLRWLLGAARLDATASGLGLSHAEPGPRNPFFPVTGNAFTATNVPYQTRGTANYTVNPMACGFMPTNVPCNGAFDLSTNGPGHISSAPCTISVANGVVSVQLDITVVQYLDESNPTMGTLTIHAIINASAPVPVGLVPFGSDWRYLDEGWDLGTEWAAPAYVDGAWLIGTAQFGYGEGDEFTTNQFGPDPNNKYITTYYRTTFSVTNPASFTNLILRVLRDDGAVVYLNDQEIFRTAMPEGPVTAATPGTTVSGAEETLYFTKYLDPAVLLAGRNVLAAEVHQSAANSSDLSFDLELAGNATFSNQAPVVAISTPTNPPVAVGDWFTVAAAATDADGVITKLELFRDAVKVGEATAGSVSVSLTGLCSGTYTFTARAVDNSAQSVTSAPVAVNVTRSFATLIAQGSVWKFLDNGTDQGTAWQALAFNDTTWASGAAQLGYGENDETTTNRYGPDVNNKYITTYYRQKFVVTDLADVVAMQLRVLRDDGAVVYLNGQEIFRSNLPTGAVTAATLASTSISGAAETTWIEALLTTNFLAAGSNILAVEIHQNTNTSSDLSFDLALLGGLAARPPTVILTNPAAGAEFPAGVPLLVSASVQTTEGAVTSVVFYAGSTMIGQADAPPYQLQLPAPVAGTYGLTARAFNECGVAVTSAPVTVTVAAFAMSRTGAVWKFLDTGAYPGAGWAAVEFNDDAWKSGPARLGYGDDGERTPVYAGPDANNKYITTWFRRAFVVTDPGLVTGLAVRLLRDDGAVVYVNGTEVFRSNLPQGAITPATLSTNTVSGAEEQAWFARTVSTTVLRAGLNVLAAEVHQSTTNSSDLGFDLELTATVGEAPASVAIATVGGTNLLRWPSWAIGYRLYQSPSLTPPIHWQPAPLAVQDDGAYKTVILPPSTNAFYRLGW